MQAARKTTLALNCAYLCFAVSVPVGGEEYLARVTPGPDWKAGLDYNSVPDTPIPGSPEVLVQNPFLQMFLRVIDRRPHSLSMSRADGDHLRTPRPVLLVASSSLTWLPGRFVVKDETTVPCHLEMVLAGFALRRLQFLGVTAQTRHLALSSAASTPTHTEEEATRAGQRYRRPVW